VFYGIWGMEGTGEIAPSRERRMHRRGMENGRIPFPGQMSRSVNGTETVSYRHAYMYDIHGSLVSCV